MESPTFCSGAESPGGPLTGDEEDGFLFLEDERDKSFMDEYRLKRMLDLQKKEATRENGNYFTGGGYVYNAQNERQILEWTTKESHVIVHFYHPSFKACTALDTHLKASK